MYDGNPNPVDPAWGPVVWTNYLYAGGLLTTNLGNSSQKWNQCIPAVKNNDADSAHRVLAADMVFWGGSGTKWTNVGRKYDINHARNDGSNLPAFQNILYGDGHVEGKGREWYPIALGTGNYSFLYTSKASYGGYCYWGRYLLDGVVNDPPVPPNPNPPPPNPNPPPPPPPPPTPNPLP
jgi:hypothetical protein